MTLRGPKTSKGIVIMKTVNNDQTKIVLYVYCKDRRKGSVHMCEGGRWHGVGVPGRGSARMLKFSVDVNKWHLIGSQ